MKRHLRPFVKPPTPPREPWADLPKESQGLVLLGIKAWRECAQAVGDYYGGKISEEEYMKAQARMDELAKKLEHLTGLSKGAILGYLSEYA
jgi:hypothetical protein